MVIFCKRSAFEPEGRQAASTRRWPAGSKLVWGWFSASHYHGSHPCRLQACLLPLHPPAFLLPPTLQTVDLGPSWPGSGSGCEPVPAVQPCISSCMKPVSPVSGRGSSSQLRTLYWSSGGSLCSHCSLLHLPSPPAYP